MDLQKPEVRTTIYHIILGLSITRCQLTTLKRDLHSDCNFIAFQQLHASVYPTTHVWFLVTCLLHKFLRSKEHEPVLPLKVQIFLQLSHIIVCTTQIKRNGLRVKTKLTLTFFEQVLTALDSATEQVKRHMQNLVHLPYVCLHACVLMSLLEIVMVIDAPSVQAWARYMSQNSTTSTADYRLIRRAISDPTGLHRSIYVDANQGAKDLNLL